MKHQALLLAALAAAFSLASATQAGIIIYAKGDSPSDGPGDQWSTAYHSIQNAINHSLPGDQIWVARGTYYERLILTAERKLYGGFRGYENSLSDRPAFPRPETDPYNTIIDAQYQGHAIHVEDSSTNATRIDGFLIRYGVSREIEDGHGRGGGIFSAGGSPTVVNNTFWLCRAGFGGAIAFDSGSPIIASNRFYANTAWQAAAISLMTPYVEITDNVFEQNSTTMGEVGGDGGAVICWSGTNVLIRGNTFTGNNCRNCGGALVLSGSGIVENNSFHNNYCDGTGNAGGAIYTSSPGSHIIRNNLFVGNTTTVRGGAIACWNSQPTITNNTFVGNVPDAIAIRNYTGAISNNIIAYNQIGIFNWIGASPVLVKNCVYGNATDYSAITPGSSDISAAPLFVSRDAGDYRITRRSPCLDQGSAAAPGGVGDHDIGGQGRINGIVDIGADELWDTVYYVDKAAGNDANGGTSFSSDALASITAAISRTDAGDRIFVAKGTYYERVAPKLGVEVYGGFQGTEITLTSRPPFPRPIPDPNETIIDGQQLGTVVTMPTGAPWTTWFDGFTVTHGESAGGGGVACEEASPTIKNCSFYQNVAPEGGAIKLVHCSPTIEQCRFGQNVATNRGAGIGAFVYSSPVVRGCTFKDCQAQGTDGGGVFCDQSEARIAGCVFNLCSANQKGGAIRCLDSVAIITNNTIVNCTAASGGAIAMNGAPRISNNIVAYNSSGLFGEGGATPELWYNCFWGNIEGNYSGVTAGPLDLSVNPLLNATSYDEYHLPYDSPCIDAGSDTAPYLPELDMDAQGRKNGRVDIGADEYWAGKVYHVWTLGSDSNSGLDPEHPLRTIGAAIAKCIFGDSVRVMTGTYDERLTLRRGVQVAGVSLVYIRGGGSGPVVSVEPGADYHTVLSTVYVRDGVGTLGGGVYCVSASPEFFRVDIRDCTAEHGGGVYISDGSPSFNGCDFDANVANGKGGAVCCLGTVSSPVFSETSFRTNTSTTDDGGAIYCEGASVDVSSCGFFGNTSGKAGGAIRCMNAYPVITSSWIARNTAQFGPGIHLHGGAGFIINNTICDNSCTLFGGGVDCYSTTAQIHNNIIAFNSGGIYASGGTMTLGNNDVFGNSLYAYSGVTAGTGDIEEDPLFVDGSHAGLALTFASPCINAGNDSAPAIPDVDYYGAPRVAAGAVDMGADESGAALSLAHAKAYAPGCPVDIDGLIVTAVFPGYYYVEQLDRSMGIRVHTPYTGAMIGWAARLQGRRWVNRNGECFIEVLNEMLTPGVSVGPLAMVNRSVGGGDYRYSLSTGAGQQGIRGGAGLNNIGSLVTVTGRVTYVDRTQWLISVWDGSASALGGPLTDGNGHSGVTVQFVNGSGRPWVSVGDMVRATGVVSCFKASGELYPMILVDAEANISTY